MTTTAAPTHPASSAADRAPAGGATFACSSACCVVSIEWDRAETWCSEGAVLKGKTKDCPDQLLNGSVLKRADGTPRQSFSAPRKANAFSWLWAVVDMIPERTDGHCDRHEDLDGLAQGKKTPNAMRLRHIPTLTKTEYKVDRAHFSLTALDYDLFIGAEINFVKGWAASVVKLGAAVPTATGGIITALTWPGYRWMKAQGLGKVYWDGAAWQPLPSGFVLADSNNFCVGFYKTGTSFNCQYGGRWPESFTDWDITAKQATIDGWKANIETIWTGNFYVKRVSCKSTAPACCRYSPKALAAFIEKPSFSSDCTIIADGNIRSNDSLFFIDEPRIEVAAHEFGHHLGNPDEYAGAAVDTSMNDDGAVAGIDANSIMGQNLTTVKKRHYRTICKHLAAMVKTQYGKTYDYKPVAV